jgi:hypothetical protein
VLTGFIVLLAAGCACAPQPTSDHAGSVRNQVIDITDSTSPAKMDAAVGYLVTFVGKAEHFSQLVVGFVRVGDEMFYVSGLEGWPPGVAGKNVRVTGLLSRRKIVLDPTVDEWGNKNGAGVWGEQYVVDHARWHIVGDAANVGPKVFTIDTPPRIYQLEPLVGHAITVEGHPTVDALREGLEVGFRYRDYFLYVEGTTHWNQSETEVLRLTGTLECRYDRPAAGLDSAGHVLVAAKYRPRYVLTNAVRSR